MCIVHISMHIWHYCSIKQLQILTSLVVPAAKLQMCMHKKHTVSHIHIPRMQNGMAVRALGINDETTSQSAIFFSF